MQEKRQEILISILMDNLRGGGAERIAVNLANGIVLRGYKVDMVLSNASGFFLSKLRPEVRVIDLKTSQLRWTLIPYLRYLLKHKPDSVLACMWPLSVIAILAYKLSRIKSRIVVAEHTTWSRSDSASITGGHRLVASSMHMLFPYADNIIAVSKGVADDLAVFANLAPEVIKVIYNPVVHGEAPFVKAPVVPEGWCFGSHHRVLAVGALRPIKDFTTLLNAFALLSKRLDVRLLILGEGELRSLLEDQAVHLGIRDVVFMPGFVKDPEPYYRHADLHVLSSTGEGLPTVIIEAIANGTPVVSTDCPSGPREILDGGKYGELVPVGDVKALADAMFDSLNRVNNVDALKERAKKFSVDKAVNHYLEVLLS